MSAEVFLIGSWLNRFGESQRYARDQWAALEELKAKKGSGRGRCDDDSSASLQGTSRSLHGTAPIGEPSPADAKINFRTWFTRPGALGLAAFYVWGVWIQALPNRSPINAFHGPLALSSILLMLLTIAMLASGAWLSNKMSRNVKVLLKLWEGSVEVTSIDVPEGDGSGAATPAGSDRGLVTENI